MPLPSDAEAILARYRSFAQKQLEVMSSPDAPDWDGLLTFVLPRQREAARADIQQHFDRGEILNTSLGVAIDPRLSRLTYPEDQIEVVDCRTDGSYWMDRATSTPVAGEIAEARPRVFNVGLRRSDNVWYISAYGYAQGTCP